MHTIESERTEKDAQYPKSLTSEQRTLLPQSAISAIDLTDAELATVSGACSSSNQWDGNNFYDDDWYGGGRRHSGGYWHGGDNLYEDGYYGYGYNGGSWYGGGNDCNR